MEIKWVLSAFFACKYSLSLRAFSLQNGRSSHGSFESKFNVQFRDFQRAALKRVLKNEVFIYALTGSGKTFYFAFIAELLEMKDLELGFGVAELNRSRENKPVTIIVSQVCSLIINQERTRMFFIRNCF